MDAKFRVFVIVVVSLLTRIAPAIGEERRHPFVPKVARVTELRFEAFYTPRVVVRRRSPKATFAVFSAEPYKLESGAALLVAIESVSAKGRVERFRCVARIDVAECLGVRRRFRYLPGDEKIVLTAVMVPRDSRALVAFGAGR